MISAGGKGFADECSGSWVFDQINDCTEAKRVELECIRGDDACVVVVNCRPKVENVDGNS